MNKIFGGGKHKKRSSFSGSIKQVDQQKGFGFAYLVAKGKKQEGQAKADTGIGLWSMTTMDMVSCSSHGYVV